MPFRLRASATVAVLLAAAGVASVPGAAPAAPAASSAPAVRMNEIQVIGTHNSYHRELSFEEKQIQQQEHGDANFWNLEYSHASLPAQFGAERVRSLELDVFPDPEGGLYAEPLVRGEAGLPPLDDPAYQRPGFKVLHWADHDYGTNCVAFADCLRQVRQWSRANPTHAPLSILLEMKSTDPAMEEMGGPTSPLWNGAMLEDLDAEIRSVFGEEDLITPDDIRRPGQTLEQSVLQDGWPALRASRGTVMFLLNQGTAPATLEYLDGHPNLENRVLFPNSLPGQDHAAFIGHDDPLGANEATIRDFVERGYLVRTRADVPFAEASSGDTERLRAALDSGAQIISTDFPVVGLAARHGSDYVAELPGGHAVRCNPVNAPAQCVSGRLER
ncbi:phosphatidylinositol-specific phospholipase C1-like protein [Streptomyces sp. 6N223]|uniref:phosphatidylinositol-specific phospholipase C1-like protein n=1 Tax=Streptomyces sp. 6N223 TaxID=3457412 RepID=UPI003FCF2C25